MTDHRVEVAWDAKAQLGEGPLWLSPYLYFVDINAPRANRLNVESGTHRFWEFPTRVTCIVPTEVIDIPSYSV